MVKIEVVPATAAHIEALIPNVRQADLDEFAAINGWGARRVLETGLRTSTFTVAGLADGRVVTVFGVAPASMLGGAGIPWLVATDELEKYQFAFLRRCRNGVNAMLDVYPYLENYVDERNHVAKAWLHWLGFTIEEAAPIGIAGLNFHRFHQERK
jgi:hypothetical protein